VLTVHACSASSPTHPESWLFFDHAPDPLEAVAALQAVTIVMPTVFDAVPLFINPLMTSKHFRPTKHGWVCLERMTILGQTGPVDIEPNTRFKLVGHWEILYETT